MQLKKIGGLTLQFKFSIVVGEATVVGDDSSWNDGIAKYSKYIDAITFHDYSFAQSLMQNMTDSEQRTFIPAYGLSMKQNIAIFFLYH